MTKEEIIAALKKVQRLDAEICWGGDPDETVDIVADDSGSLVSWFDIEAIIEKAEKP